MITINIQNEEMIQQAIKLGHHQTAQETVEQALDYYLNYLKQCEIINSFGTVEFDPDYDYKKQRS